MNTAHEPTQTPTAPPSTKQADRAYRAYKKSLKQDISLKRKYLNAQNRNWPVSPIQVCDAEWPKMFAADQSRIAVWRSFDYLIQVFRVRDGLTRLSVNRTELDDQGRFKDHITWEELMWIKEACGFGDKDAVEVFPRTIDIVNISNLRHIFVFDELQTFVWRIQDKPADVPSNEQAK